MNAKANRNKSATATSTQKTPAEHPFFLSGCREGEDASGGISSLIVFYAQHLSAGEQARGLRLPGQCEVCIAKVGVCDVGGGEVGPSEVGSAEVGPAEEGPGEVGPAEVGPAEVGSAEVGSPEVNYPSPEVGVWANPEGATGHLNNPGPQPGIRVDIFFNPHALRVERYGAEGDDDES